jgi:hypothetical protein
VQLLIIGLLMIVFAGCATSHLTPEQKAQRKEEVRRLMIYKMLGAQPVVIVPPMYQPAQHQDMTCQPPLFDGAPMNCSVLR